MARPSAEMRNRSVIRRAQPRSNSLLFVSVPTPLGRVRLVASATAVVRVELPGPQAEARLEAWLTHHFPQATRRRGETPVLRKAAQQIEAYFTASLQSFSLPLELAGTPFQLAVWKHVGEIPFGATRSYGAIARALGNPKAVRAVGAAQGANPVPIVIPCHRVVGSDGGLIGYGGGLPIKRWLLDHERERVDAGERVGASPGMRQTPSQLSLFGGLVRAPAAPPRTPCSRPPSV